MKTYRITHEVSQEDLENILESAWTGMTYWADEAHVVGDEAADLNTALFNGKYIKIHDSEENVWHNLTLKKLLNGLSLTDDLDFEAYDMYDAECVVQRALFGKVIYG